MTSQTGVLTEIVSLENLEPSITVNQNDGHSFKRSVNFTGTAHDGQWAGIYASDELARWDQQGAVDEVQVKDPFTSDWVDMRLAVDDSNSNGEVTYNNHPFSHWYFEFDMSDQPEGDYTFEFRASDGVTESQIVGMSIKLEAINQLINLLSALTFKKISALRRLLILSLLMRILKKNLITKIPCQNM